MDIDSSSHDGNALPEPLEVVLRILTGGLAAVREATLDMAEIRTFVAEDVVFHVFSGVAQFAHDYLGIEEFFEKYFSQLAARTDSATADVQTLTSNEDFVVTLGTSTMSRHDATETWKVASVSRLQSNRIAEVWLFSSSLNDPDHAASFWDLAPIRR